MTCFIHTSDWQIGKPFANIRDQYKRSLVQQARVNVLKRINHFVEKHQASFVLVAGDLFDTNTPDKSTVAITCSTIGQMEVPVLIIPGNHDHAGAGSIWEQAFFQREQSILAPNLHVLLSNKAFELDDAVIYPCPLQNRLGVVDSTAWLRNSEVFRASAMHKPRIIMAHGSIERFTGRNNEEEGAGSALNYINIDLLPIEEIDYVALGDWHGTKQISPKTWYSGTPEIDRFPKGEDYTPGQILIVQSKRGKDPLVQIASTTCLNWQEVNFEFSNDDSINHFTQQISDLLCRRANQDLLKLTLNGSLSITATSRLDALLESFDARILRLKLTNNTTISPSEDELDQLICNISNPLISSVAQQLVNQYSQADDETAEITSLALKMLYSAAGKDINS